MTGLNRALVVMIDGKPVTWCLTQGEVFETITGYPDHYACRFSIWSVYYRDTPTVAHDDTLKFARDWSKRFKFGGGIAPAEFLSPFPAFVIANISDELEAEYVHLLNQPSKGQADG